MQKFPNDWDIVTKISYLQRKIIISSILYYEMNESPISDREYDELSKQLVELSKDGIQGTQYEYVFKDFDGTTGFDLRNKLTEKDRDYLTHIAWFIGGRKFKEKEPVMQEVPKLKGMLF